MFRIGIVGVGNMGRAHAQYIKAGRIRGAELTAVCDISPKALEWVEDQFGDEVKRFSSMEEMLKSGLIDGVIIATPHYDHPPLAIQGFNAGLHVLVEKPAGVYTKQVEEMNLAAQQSGKVFGIMFNQRTNPLYQKVRELVQSGELGDLKRVIWIITDWYRSQSYYDSGGWRATWAGEGGGVLLNQAPHQLDLWQWIFGMPSRIRAFCHEGKFHDIEVEDDVTAYLEYANGTTGVFITTTGDTPGTNRLEISGTRGKLVVEHDELKFWRLRLDERKFNEEYKGGFGEPECWLCEVPTSKEVSAHPGITQNWVDACLKGTPLLAPGEEGIYGLTLSNAMYLSSWLDNWVELPIDADLFYQKLQEKIASSRFEKKAGSDVVLDVEGTF
ncbi:MAG: Gfo/Idh/MocA family oxidoreductase [Firmicutes bacterium]|nr:Gfo/Idh/MocA family oxidoreductase [Bacillota bacterium]